MTDVETEHGRPATATERDVRPVQRDGRPRRALGRELAGIADVLLLQSTAGNAATSRWVQHYAGNTVVRRRMKFGLKDLEGDVSLAAVINKSTFKQIRAKLKEYDEAKTARDELHLLQELEVLVDEWLAKRESTDDGKDAASTNASKKGSSLKRLRDAIRAELDALGPEQQADYAERIKATTAAVDEEKRTKKRASGKDTAAAFKFITDSGAAGADTRKFDDARTYTDETDQQNKQRGSVRDAAKAQTGGRSVLSDAEIASIRVYSGGDYKFINPDMEGSDSWLAANVKSVASGKDEAKFGRHGAEVKESKGRLDTKDRRELKQEARQHRRVMMSGLEKMDNVKGPLTTYRGMSIAEDALRKDYADGRVLTWRPFTSTSMKQNVSEAFALPKDGKVGLLLVLTVHVGRDISEISVKREGEVVLFPGAQFKVTGPPRLEKSPLGAHQRYVVQLVQVGAGDNKQMPPQLAQTAAPGAPAADDVKVPAAAGRQLPPRRRGGALSLASQRSKRDAVDELDDEKQQ